MADRGGDFRAGFDYPRSHMAISQVELNEGKRGERGRFSSGGLDWLGGLRFVTGEATRMALLSKLPGLCGTLVRSM